MFEIFVWKTWKSQGKTYLQSFDTYAFVSKIYIPSPRLNVYAKFAKACSLKS